MSVIGLLGEGFESALFPCSLILLVPGLAVGLASRAAAIAGMAAFGLSTLALSWLRFSDRGGDFPAPIIAIGLFLAVISLQAPLRARLDVAAVGGGLLAGASAAELWRPCVGAEFGQLLNELPDRGLSGLALLAVTLVGTLSPLIAIGAIHHLLPDHLLDRLEPAWAVVGSALLAVLALATAVGLHDDLVGRLFLWSL